MKCDEQVVPLVKSLTNEVNKNEGRGTKIALEASIFKGTCLL